MSQIIIDIPEQSLLALNRTPEQFSEVLRMAAAVKLYELGQLSSGAAAELAGIPKPVFLSRLADYGVDNFIYDPESLKRETRLA
jgi:predicted HTH domain antitoxin